jgi:hypothetical protein
MINTLNTIAVTLLVAVLCVFPAALIGQHVPGVFNPTLKPIAVAAWLAAMVSWYIAREVTRKQQRQAQQQESRKSNNRAAGFTVAFLAIAIGVVAALHFFGDGLIAETLTAVTP